MKKHTSLFIFGFIVIVSVSTLQAQWTQIGLASSSIRSIAERANGDLFVGTDATGLYRRVSGTSNWTQVLGPSSVYKVYSIGFDSSGGVTATKRLVLLK